MKSWMVAMLIHRGWHFDWSDGTMRCNGCGERIRLGAQEPAHICPNIREAALANLTAEERKRREMATNHLRAVQGEGAMWLMVDEDNKRTYKPGELFDTGERDKPASTSPTLQEGDTLIVMDKDGNLYRWTSMAWESWNSQLSDSMRTGV